MQQIPVVFDCDITMGIPGCDIDDGLTLLFLLGCRDVDLLGVCCSYGNSSQGIVFDNAVRLLDEWGRQDIPVMMGSEDPGFRKAYMETGVLPPDTADRRSPAAVFLAQKAAEYKGRICVIATGAMSNLAGAAEYDPAFFSNVKTVSIMGGITEELFVGGRHMDELNLSCDPYASLRVIRETGDLMIATAQNALSSFFDRNGFEAHLRSRPGIASDMLKKETAYWFEHCEDKWNCPGFVNWDVMAAVQMLDAASLDLKRSAITPDIGSLCTGMLAGSGTPITVTLPEIRDHDSYTDSVYDHYFRDNIIVSRR